MDILLFCNFVRTMVIFNNWVFDFFIAMVIYISKLGVGCVFAIDFDTRIHRKYGEGWGGEFLIPAPLWLLAHVVPSPLKGGAN